MTPERARAAALAAGLTLGAAHSACAASDPLLPGGNGKQPITITAARLEYLSKAHKATYSGNVRASQGDAHLACAKLEIFLGDKSRGGGGGVERMECSGPVTLTQKDQVGTGGHGSYDKGRNRIVLTGNVTLSQGPNIGVGDRLVYDLNSGQATLEGGPSKARVQGIFEAGSDKTGPGGPGASRKPSSFIR